MYIQTLSCLQALRKSCVSRGVYGAPNASNVARSRDAIHQFHRIQVMTELIRIIMCYQTSDLLPTSHLI